MPTIVTGIGSLSLAVTGCTGNGVSPIVLTVASVPSSVAAGQLITVAGVGGNTNANGDKTITAVTTTTITFAGTGNGAYTSGGTISRKYATIEAWNTATVGAIGTGNIKIGEMYADSVFEQLTPTNLTLTGATSTTATQYRMLRAWSGHRYRARLDDGVKVRRAVNQFAAVNNLLTISEPFFRLDGIGFEIVDSNPNIAYITLDQYVVKVSSENTTITGCTFDGSGFKQQTGTPGLVNLEVKGGSYIAFNLFLGAANDAIANEYALLVLNSAATAGIVCNNTVYGFKSGGIVSTHPTITFNGNAVYSTSSGPCIGVPPGKAFNCLVSDIGVSYGLSVGCKEGVLASAELAYTEFKDARPVEAGEMVTSKVAALEQGRFVTDIEGNVLPTGFEALVNIGCHNVATVPQANAAITVVEKTIGSGGDYASIAAWEADTDNHLVGLNQIQRGFLLDASYSEQVTISGAITDRRRYRELRYAGGNRYNITAQSGATITSASTGAVVTLAEKWARLTGVKVAGTNSSTTQQDCVRITASYCTVDSVVAEQAAQTGSNISAGFAVTGNDVIKATFRNCIALGNSNTAGLNYGFYLASGVVLLDATQHKVQNCLAARIRRGASATCFYSSATSNVFENCVAGSSDVGFDSNTYNQQRYCAALDATAKGLGSLPNLVAGNIFQDGTGGDFRPKVGSALIDSGVALDLDFTSDINGARWTRPWNMGPFVGYVRPPMYPAAKTYKTHRYVPIWKIQTKLGDNLRIAGHDSNLYHDGELYEAQSGIDTTAYRAEGGLRDHQLEAFGFISSDRITYADLDAGVYNNAKVTMSLVDWRYPWLEPIHKQVFFLRRIRFDGETWRAEAEGLSSVLKKITGRVYSPLCPYQLGSPNPDGAGRAGCGVDISLYTEFDVEVATVSDSRRIFRAKSSAPNELDGAFADGYFKQGVVTWTSGANINRSSDVIAYTQSTREITLAIELPYEIQVGDRFNIVHGDDHTIDTCHTRFANAANFGGDPYIPGAQKAFQTP